MPFNIDLENLQRTKLWTFKTTDFALELQSLLDKNDRVGYVSRLKELSNPTDGTPPHRFSKTDKVVYEMLDEGKEIEIPIKLQVKNSVITWYFSAPKDRTHQSFRDLIFTTAAKAHASVNNSCETYYRGTNHYHLKVMHTHEGEAGFNHNHYRTANDGPITPEEFYQHLMAFCAQSEGRQFIPTERERDEIILKFALYWAEFNTDINYAAFGYLEGGSERVNQILEDIAKVGALTPDQADIELDKFFSSEHGKNMFELAIKFGFPPSSDFLEYLKQEMKENYRVIFNRMNLNEGLGSTLDPSLEPHQLTSSNTSSSQSRKSSPRDEYLGAKDQSLDEIDKAEYSAFAEDLTKHCQSINKELLEDLTLEDFRKGLLLYHALRTAQKSKSLEPEKGQRFHRDVTTNEQISEMIKELPSLQYGSTEDSLGAPLINKLLQWITTASPKLDEWVAWVSENGSRGLGSELAAVREADGTVNLGQAVPPDDRSKDSSVATIDFDKVDLRQIFLPGRDQNQAERNEQIVRLQQALSKELKLLVTNQQGLYKLDITTFKAKLQVIDAGLSFLSGDKPLSVLSEAIRKNDGWNSVAAPKMQSRLERYVEEIFSLASNPSPDATLRHP